MPGQPSHYAIMKLWPTLWLAWTKCAGHSGPPGCWLKQGVIRSWDKEDGGWTIQSFTVSQTLTQNTVWIAAQSSLKIDYPNRKLHSFSSRDALMSHDREKNILKIHYQCEHFFLYVINLNRSNFDGVFFLSDLVLLRRYDDSNTILLLMFKRGLQLQLQQDSQPHAKSTNASQSKL